MKANQDAFFIQWLERELVPAMGCTEPISICFAAAKVAEVLGKEPDKIHLQTSGSLYKNAKGVNIPNTHGLTGVKMSAIIGAIGGDGSKALEVLENVKEADIQRATDLLDTDFCTVELLHDGNNIHVIMSATAGKDTALVEIIDSHVNIVRIEKNDEIIFEKEVTERKKTAAIGIVYEDIFDFVDRVPVEQIEKTIQKQIDYNKRMVEAGLSGDCSHGVGKLLAGYLDMTDPFMKARAYTTAACEARMEGVSLPAMANGGSGNQGITCSVPVYIYGVDREMSEEDIIRGVALSDLTFLYLKKEMGLLSACCSGIVAATAAAAGWMYMETKNIDKIKQVIQNTIGNISGIFCDGAKGSCALKISTSLDAGILAYKMVENNNSIALDDGIIAKDFERTVKNLGKIVREGMRPVNEMIIDLMYQEELVEEE